MGGLSIWHWVIILVVVILLFGAKKLPEAARGVGRSLRILKSEVNAMSDDKKEAEAAAQAQAAAQAPILPQPAVPVAVVSPVPTVVQPIPAPEALNTHSAEQR